MPNLARLANLNFVEKQPLYNEVGYNYVDICSFFQKFSGGWGLGVGGWGCGLLGGRWWVRGGGIA